MVREKSSLEKEKKIHLKKRSMTDTYFILYRHFPFPTRPMLTYSVNVSACTKGGV